MEQPSTIVETPLSNEERAQGAQFEESEGCLLPALFSDFDKEYRAARENVAIFDTNWHAIFSFAGRDRVKYLHAVTSNNIKQLGEGYGMLALLLNPQGRILAELEVYAEQEKLLALSHASVRERTFTTLKKYILGSQVQLEDLTDQMGSFAIEGPHAATVIAQASSLALPGFSNLAFAHLNVDGVPCYMIRHSHFGSDGAEFVAPREHLGLLWNNLHASVVAVGGQAIGMKTLNALRLENRIPRFPVDFNDSQIPHEAVVEDTHISFNKGCYTGQEIVERVRSRGQVNRKRVSLKFSTAEPPAPGTKLRVADAEVGYVTSSTFSPATGSSIGMGYVRREHNAPGSIVEFAEGTATVS